MPNLAQTIKEEISRVARREIKAETSGLRKASSAYRGEFAALKRQIAELTREVASLRRTVAKVAPVKQDVEAVRRRRLWSPARIKALRARLGLSMMDFGTVLGGVSAVTVHKWEHGVTPRSKGQRQLDAISSIGRREARARLG